MKPISYKFTNELAYGLHSAKVATGELALSAEDVDCRAMLIRVVAVVDSYNPRHVFCCSINSYIVP